MTKTLFGSVGRRRMMLPFVVLGLLLTFAGSTLAAGTEPYTVVNKFSYVQHFDPYPPCNDFGGSTDSVTGTERGGVLTPL